ncbi:MAG TPA: hypothetical protein VGF21_13565 [Thermoleophilaceae bacterium]|jgi:hypothetical protein
MEGVGQGYAPPRVRDYGDLVALTRADATLMHVGVGGVAAASSTPLAPGGTAGATQGGGELGAILPATQGGGSGTPTGSTAPGGTLGTGAGGGAGGGTGGGAGGGVGGGGGGSLPFTGFAVGIVAAIGSGMTAAGVALKRRLSRARTPG